MRVIYWNIEFLTSVEQAWKAMLKIHKQVDGVDYWCLSEATPDLAKLLEKNGYHVFFRANSKVFGVLIATKHKKSLKKCRAYNLSTANQRRKRVTDHTPILLADIEFQGKSLTLSNTHLTYFRPREILRRRHERRILVKCLPRQKSIFGGDLNTFIIPFAKWDVVNLGYRPKARGKTWRQFRGEGEHRRQTPFKLQLDHVLVTPDLAAHTSAVILGQQAVSDHFPTLVTVS